MNRSKDVSTAKVLLVDDECQQLELRAFILRMAGFSVLTAYGPIDALSVVSKFDDIDIAVVDYEMPIMNGGALSDCLKAKIPNLNIVLYSSAHSIPADDVQKANTLIPKGEGIGVLLRHLRSVCVQIIATRSRSQSISEFDQTESPPNRVARGQQTPLHSLSMEAS